MKRQLSILQFLLLFTVVGYSQTVLRIEAESFDEASGARAETNSSLSGGGNVGYITNGTWIKFSGQEFGQYDTRFDVAASSDTDGGVVEFRLDAVDGTLIATANIVSTGNWGDYQIVSADITETTGTHDLYLVFTGTSGYLFNVDYFEKVTEDPTAVTYTLTTSVSPENSGTVTSSLAGNEFAEGTEITLTANDNFGFDFVRWVDGSGTEVSTDNPFTFNITSDVTYVAEFSVVDTYTLTVNASGAYGLGDYTISPEGKEGEYAEYESGTIVTVTAVENDIITFNNWSTGSTDLSIDVVMNQNVELTGNYENENFIAGWTFKDDAYAQSWPAELNSKVENHPELFAYNVTDNSLSTNLRVNNRSGQNGISVWNSDRGEFFYFMTSFSTIGYQNIAVQSELLAYYYGCDEWTLQYSLDGTSFTDISDLITINGSSYSEIGGLLPSEVENQEKVYIRWYPNINGPKHGDPSDVTATKLANVSIFADETSLNLQAKEHTVLRAYPNPTNGVINLEISGFNNKLQYAVYTISGQKVLNGNVSQDHRINLKNLNKGMYLLNLINDKGENFNVRVVKN